MPNRRRVKVLFHTTAITGVLVGLSLYLYAPMAEAPVYLFTTNIDQETKTIHERPISSGWSLWLSRVSQQFHDTVNLAAFELAAVQNVANPKIKVVYIPNGMRKEQIAEKLGRALGWGPENRKAFLTASVPVTAGKLDDGYFYPGLYTFKAKTSGFEAAGEMIGRFQLEILERYPENTSRLVPLSTALTVASLIEREAANREDMFRVSGVIWNRLFADMPLGIDATLQYTRGTSANRWWPKVRSADKFVKSPYNTYKQVGLPPGPIANPGIASIEAALNPIKTDCLYYLHDKNREFHCARTYEEHKENIKTYY